MKVNIVTDENHKINLRIPLSIIKLRFVRKKVWTKAFTNLSAEEIKKNISNFYKQLKTIKKQFPNLVIIDIESADGNKVKITL